MTDPLGLIRSTNPYGSAPIGPLPGSTGSTAGGSQFGQGSANSLQGPSFKDIIKQIDDVNNLQQDAENAVNDMMTGKPVNAAMVMTAQAKADTAFLALLQVRNKFLDMYTEIKDVRV